jgi:hypothetical protein
MIVHLAVFTFSAAVTDKQVGRLEQALNDMAAQIPVIRHYVCGPALHLLDGGADFGVLAVLDQPEHLREYLGHPLHADVQKTFLDHMVTERRAVQLPVPAGIVRD